MAFIDIDEYLHAVSKSLPALLQDYEAYGGLFVHWQHFGSSGHITMPTGGVVENFTQRAPATWSRNREGKSIVRPTMVSPWGKPNSHKRIPHGFDLMPGEILVTENGEVISPHGMSPIDRITRFFTKRLGRTSHWLGSWFPKVFNPYGSKRGHPKAVSVSRVMINHYSVKSKGEYALKMKRMSAKPYKYNTTFFRFHDRNEVEDLTLRDEMRKISPH